MRKLKTLIEHRKALMQYYLEYYSTATIFKLQKVMLEKGICPRCGTISRSYSGHRGHFPCSECGFWITPQEINKILDDSGSISLKTQKRILKNRIIKK